MGIGIGVGMGLGGGLPPWTPAALSNLKLWLKPESLTNPNRLLYTEDFTNAAWTKVASATVVTSGETDPGGGTEAFLVKGNSGAWAHVLQNAVGFQVSADEVGSLYIKRPAGHDGVSICTIRLEDGVKTTTIYNGVPPATWTRVQQTHTADASATAARIRIYPHNANPSTQDLLVYHPQLEVGTVATAYVANGATAGGILASWPDSSGQGNDLAQGTQANMGLVEAELLDGYAGLLLDGVDDHMLATLAASVTQPFFIGAVYGPLGYVSNDAGTVFSGNAAGKCALDISVAGTDDFSMTAGTVLRSGVAAAVAPTWRLHEGLFNGASSQIYIDGVSKATGAAGSNDLTTDVFLGANPTLSGALGGYIVEIIVIDGTPSADELTEWRTYVGKRYPSGPSL